MGNGLKGLLSVVLGLAVGLLLFGAMPQAHALPEYATRTGEPCATCHVNPAGGGARTARSALWIAAGRPDKVPELPAGAQPVSTSSEAAQAPAQADVKAVLHEVGRALNPPQSSCGGAVAGSPTLR